MSPQTKILRRQIRAAIQIHSHLAGMGRFGPIPILYDHEWDDLSKMARRFELVRDKGWQAAADSLLSDLDLSAANLGRRVDRFRSELSKIPSSMQVSAPRDIAADLAALEEEFVEVEVNIQDKKLLVLTSPIELEDTYLGTFRIVLHWEAIGKSACYEVVAEDPHPADGYDHVTHPHVADETLCEGEGSAAIRKALAQGRFLDFFTLVKQILETYNPASAYVSLSRWNGGRDCYDCGGQISADESWCCSRCSATVCDCCHSSCEACEETLCSGCCTSCSECNGTFCRDCLEFRFGSRVLVCSDCLEKGNTSDDDETPTNPEAEQSDEECASGATSPPDSLCLEEAFVLA